MATTITLELPERTASQLAQVARSQRTTISAVVQTLLDEQPTTWVRLPQEVETELEALHYLSTDLLRLVAQSTLSPVQQQRLAELSHQQQTATGLNTAEQTEQNQLLDLYDRTMVRRATAINILRQRGADWQTLITPV